MHATPLSLRRSPSISLLASEPARALMDFMVAHLPSLPLPKGDGHPVIVYPGLGAGAWSTERLRTALASAGYEVSDWGRGQNHGPRGSVADWTRSLSDDVRAIRRRHGRDVSLVGWSLGGIYAREIARAAPDHVRQVVTLGSPFAGTPTATHAAWLYRLLNKGRLPSAGDTRGLRAPISVPCTSIYSKADGVVPWRACLQPRSALSENIEVANVSHLGMGSNRRVLEIVADRLAQPEDDWQRFKRRAA